ncbi:MAG TPA: hypothetical protein VK774_07175 [Solirubrobacteraceae bacterium]|nr:hypothetical protein [Solirubrobacteraceae bacterium]
MTEQDPFQGKREPEPTNVQLDAPNTSSTFQKPLRPDAQRAHDAVIRKHLQDRRSGPERPGAGR